MKEKIIKTALEHFIQYGFKTFTMDDLAKELGISKKTLYEHFATKNILVEACLDSFIDTMKAFDFTQGEGSIIERIFASNVKIQQMYKITNARPLWELQKHFPELYERLDAFLLDRNFEWIDYILEQGRKEGIFHKYINDKFYKAFYVSMNLARCSPKYFPETEFPLWDTILNSTEYFLRILVNEKGLKELERVLQSQQTFTMDDLAKELGISKKTLYEHFATKNILVEACLDSFIDTMKAFDFTQGEGSIIERIFASNVKIQQMYKITNARPLWELQKHFPELYERLDAFLLDRNFEWIDYILEQGRKEGIFHKYINDKFYKAFYVSMNLARCSPKYFPETEFPLWDTILNSTEYFLRILVNEKGLKELERVLQSQRQQSAE